VPTLTTETTGITEAQLMNDYTLNITSSDGDGSCTSTDFKACGVRSNATLGTIIPPVRSARLTTKGKKGIKYGRVEIVAKMAQGDWLWPAICEFLILSRPSLHVLTSLRDYDRGGCIRRLATLR
jgi:beta-glucanase (GH16 family)